MGASTVDRNTPAKLIERQITIDLASGQDIPAGVMVARNAAGLAVNASDTASTIVEGRSAHRATYANGDRKIVVQRGVFLYANNGNVVAASLGKPVTVVDNQTVGLAADTTNDIVAGIADEITADGVFVAQLGGVVAAA